MGKQQTKRYTLRTLTRKDIPEVGKLQQRADALYFRWSPGQMESHMRNFAEGQVVVEVDGGIVAALSSLIVSGIQDERLCDWMGATGNGYFHTHTLSGDTLYVASVSLDLDADREHLRELLYAHLKELVASHGLRRLTIGSRLSGYAAVARELSPVQYLGLVKDGQAEEPLLSFQLDRGFQVLGPLLGTQDIDGAQARLAMLLEWRADAA